MKSRTHQIHHCGQTIFNRLPVVSQRPITFVTVLTLPFFLACYLASGQAINLSITNLGNRSNAILGQGFPGQVYVLQTSEDVSQTNWQNFGSVTAGVNGAFAFTDSIAMQQRFYRSAFLGATNQGPGFGPAAIPGLAYYWNYSDLAQDTRVTNWTDRVQGLAFNSSATTAYPINRNMGVYFHNARALTNANVMLSTNDSLWMVVRTDVASDSAGHDQIFGSYTATSGFYMTEGFLDAHVTNHYSTGIKIGEAYDLASRPLVGLWTLAYSGGVIYTNGSGIGINVGRTNLFLNALGNNAAATAAFNGYYQYIGIWTNYALTLTDIAKLHSWAWTNGVTNITEGLLAWWEFDEGSGTNVTDSSGNGRHGMFSRNVPPRANPPEWTNNAVLNSGLTFKTAGGVTGSGGVDTTNFADALTNYSIAGWIRMFANIGAQGIVISKMSSPDGEGWLLMNESEKLVFVEEDLVHFVETADSTGQGRVRIDDDPPFKWHHFVACRDSTSNIWLYIDGVIASDSVVGTGLGSVGTRSNSNPVRLGDSRVPYYNNILHGAIDDIRIYDRVLTPKEVQILFRWRGQP